MLKRKLTIVNHLGMHARAAAKFVTAASQFQSTVQLCKEMNQVDGKSIMGILMLAAAKGESVVICVEGPDEEEALQTLSALIGEQSDATGRDL